MRFLRSNTAVIITVGPFFDKTDGVTPETALTATNEHITLTADTDAGSAPTLVLDATGAGSGSNNDFVHITNDDAGFYSFELAAADVNRVGRMFLAITDAANHVPVFHEFFVLPATIFDWLTGVTANLSVNVDTIKTNPVVNGGTITFPTTATLASTTNITAATGIDVTKWNGTTVATPATAGIPDVNVKNAANVAWASGAITAAVLADASIDIATFAADVPSLAMRTGTATAGGATTITLDAGASAVDDFYNNTIIFLTGGTGAGQSRRITDYVQATKVATVGTWATNPDNTSTFAILPDDATTISDKTGFSLTSAYDPAKTAAQAGDAMALTSGERNSTADALLDRSNAIETNITPRGALRLTTAMAAGKTNGMDTAGTAHVRDVADGKNRVTATTDGAGNRTATSVDTT